MSEPRTLKEVRDELRASGIDAALIGAPPEFRVSRWRDALRARE